MITFRSLNYDDIKHYVNNENISCSLINTYNRDKSIKNGETYYNLCINGNFEYALDILIGHVSGGKLKVGTSPFISTSYDFRYVASEYSIPQAGKYNFIKERKPIIMMDIDEDEILFDEKEIAALRKTKVDKCVLDMTTGRLEKCFDTGAISAEKYNMDMPGYDIEADVNRELNNSKTKATGFSNYLDASSEILIYKEISKEDIKAYFSPKLIDVLYACNVDMGAYYRFIINHYEEIEDYLNKLGDTYIGNNLVDILVDNYNAIPGMSIEDKYNELKDLKKVSIAHVAQQINHKYNTNFEVGGLLDDRVYVTDYNRLNKFTRKSKNDVLVIEKDNKLYVHNFDKDGYYNQENDSLIPTSEVIKKVK